MKYSAILLAAGKGTRYKEKNKMLFFTISPYGVTLMNAQKK